MTQQRVLVLTHSVEVPAGDFLGLGIPTTGVTSTPLLLAALDDGVVLVVIAPDVPLAEALDVASGQRVARPDLGVVLMRTKPDAGLLKTAMRAGVREVVGADDDAGLLEACQRSLELTAQLSVASAPAASPAPLVPAVPVAGQVVTVFAAKGGCGKTTVATNLAVSVAEAGRSVCLIDLDLAFGDVAIALQLDPKRTLSDAVAMAGHVDETGIRSLITPYRPHLDALLAPVEPGAAEAIPASLVGELLAVLRTMYDVVVVDTPPAFTDHVLAAFDASDRFVLVASLDVPALKNLKLTLEMLDLLNFDPARREIVLNRSDSKVGLTLGEVQDALGAKVSVQIPSSRAVPSAINRGVPIVLDAPGHAVSAAIRSLAARIAPKPASSTSHGKGRRLLRRRVTA
ncbi:MAG: AAA family ATPase [Frankiaceae bacterium]|nr:AAA family ATPase [Frankiaceae bacterium]